MSIRLRIVLAVLGGVLVCVAESDEPPVTRWADPQQKIKPKHAAPGITKPALRGAAVAPAAAPRPLGVSDASRGRVCVIATSNLLAQTSVSNALETYRTDLLTAGYSTIMYRFDAGNAEGVRAYLSNLYTESASLAGAVLVGPVPHIIYELWQEFDEYPAEYEDFPCDIFYMDLNGGWHDYSNAPPYAAGKYDTRSGNLDLEIWVSRMRTDTLSMVGTEAPLLTNFFSRNHQFRAAHSPTNALVYNDDDWAYLAAEDAEFLARVYMPANVVMVSNRNDTTRDDYVLNRLTRGYECIALRSHGTPISHQFEQSGSTYTVYNSDYTNKNPRTPFFSLYVCSAGDYTVTNNLARITVFNPRGGGMAAWSSSKMGGMWSASEFYTQLAQGNALGFAFVQWFNSVQNWYPNSAPRWWYGMVLSGDAALPLVEPATLYVAPNGAHVSPFGSWASASTSLHAAVNAALYGNHILVSDGVYYLQYVLTNKNGMTVRSLHGPEHTVIDCGFPARTNVQIHLVNQYTTLDGFTVRNGYSANFPYYYAGGINEDYTAVKSLVRNCIVCSNRVYNPGTYDYGYAGGIFAYGRVENCRVFHNEGEVTAGGVHVMQDASLSDSLVFENFTYGTGGGVDAMGSVERCVISNNIAAGSGGGIYAGAGPCMMRDCTIIGNCATQQGGGVFLRVKDTLRNCLITGNTASNGAGVASGDYWGAGSIENCTIAGNTAWQGAGGLYGYNGVTCINTIVYHNTSPGGTNIALTSSNIHNWVRASCTWPAVSNLYDAGGNLTSDPAFVDADNGNFRLQFGSPCINAGSNMAWMVDAVDMGGQPRVQGGHVDIGCYEAVPESVAGALLATLALVVHGRRKILSTKGQHGETPRPRADNAARRRAYDTASPLKAAPQCRAA